MKNKFILISGTLLLIFVLISLILLKKGDNRIEDSKKGEVIEKLDNNKTDIIYSSTGEVQHSQASDIE